jgi:hypothetical protein
MRILLLSLILPMLPLITVHVGAHPLKSAASGKTNDILAQSQEQSNGQPSDGLLHPNTNGNSQSTPSILLGTVRADLLFLHGGTGTRFEAGRHKCLQKLFGIFIRPHAVGPELHSTDGREEEMLQQLKLHASGFHATMGLAWEDNGRANGSSPNGHPQTNGNSDLVAVRRLILSYHDQAGDTEEAKGKRLEDLLSILTSPRVPSWGGVSSRERTWLDPLRTHALALKDAMYEAYTYYHVFLHLS